MERLLDAVAAVVCLVSPEKVQAIASRVIPPFLAVVRSRAHAAKASFCFGVMPPSAMFGRS
jgi:hypothetical protein